MVRSQEHQKIYANLLGDQVESYKAAGRIVTERKGFRGIGDRYNLYVVHFIWETAPAQHLRI